MTTSKSKQGYIALKIDLEKSFDRLEWGFIYHVLNWFNFPKDWIDLIMSCISSSTLSILVNGELLDPFLPSRGIRQGDPLSPYIFILCMEYLVCLILFKVFLGNWSDVKTSRDGPSFSHFFFADDLILFAKATKKNCLAIQKFLNVFCTSSGQKVNSEKSKIFFSPLTKDDNINFIEIELGIRRSMDFGKYLGVPITTDGWNKRAFDFILDKVCARLSGWKVKSLSLAGCMTLITSVTSSVPTHLMQCTLLPSRICNELDRLNRNFLWGDLSTKKKLHAIKWDVVTKPKHLGGLGLKKSFP